MIKAHELRIGNLVTDEWFDSFKQFILVCDINARGINLEITDDGNYSELARHFITPDYEFNKLRGIPLTEEILLKVGFEIKPFSLGLTLDRFRFIWKEEYKYWYVVDAYSQSYLTKIEFVHELQNLYFALTGKELNTEGLI